MSLQFVLGRAGSGKSEYCIERAAHIFDSGKRVIMIVPEQYSHKGESAFLEKKGFLCDDFNVTSFNRLAKKIIRDSGITSRPLDSSGKAMLLYSAISNCKKRLTFYKNALQKQGYLKLFSDAVSEFKKGQVTPEALRIASESAENSVFSARLFDLSIILEEYNRLLKDGISDSDDNITLMASLSFDSDYIRNSTIFIDEFYRFTQNEISCINTFLAMGNDVVISLCLPDEKPYENSVFSGAYATKQMLELKAKEIGAHILAPVILDSTHRFKAEELATLERALSNPSITPQQNDVNDISLHIAKSRYEEVLCCASKIRRYVKENSASYRDIAVVAGDYDGYKDLVSTIFPLYDIPVFSDTRHDFLSHPIVLYLFSLLDLLSGITTKRVISYMKSGFADINDETALKLENYALAGAIEYADWQNDERFLRKSKSVFGVEEEQTEESIILLNAKNALLSPVFLLKEKISESKNLKDRIFALKSFFEETNLNLKIENKIREFISDNLQREAEEFSEVFSILSETLDEMAVCLGEETAGLSSLTAILEAGLSEKSIGVIPTVYDEISFGDLGRSVIKNARATFVLGANDGIFPPVPSPDALLSDEEREFLLSRKISVAPESKKRISDAEFSVYSAITSAREKLFVSYPISKDDGSGLRPSMFVSKLKRTFPKIKTHHELDSDTLSPESFVASKQSAYTYVLTHIKDVENNETTKALFDELKKDSEYSEKLDRAIEFSKFANNAGRLSQDTVSSLYGKDLYGSVSRFERFSSCPFSFFIEYGLKAKERKVLKVEAPDMGSLLHEIIERFSKVMKSIGESYRTITQEKQKDITDAIIDEMFSTMFIKNIYSAKRVDALKNRLKSLVSKSVWAICEHVAKGSFEPAEFELSFDNNGDLEPVTIPMSDGGKITLIGRIDRIDTLTHEGKLYIKIIDYKSGSKQYSLADIFNGTTLQLAVYSFVAIEGIKKKSNSDTAFGGMFYFHLDDPVLESTPNSSASEESAIKSFKMSGLAPDDESIIKAIDCGINGSSLIIPVYMKNDGSISKARSKTATAEEFSHLTKYIKTTVSKIGEEIMSGNVDIYPVRNGKTMPCSYCKYYTICGFDPDIHPCRKATEFKNDEEIWEEIKGQL